MMTQHMRIGLLVAVVVLAGAIWGTLYYFNQATVDPGRTQVLAVITALNEPGRTVFVLLPSGKSYILPIAEDVVIRRAVFSTIGTQETVRQEELNISDLTKGSSVTVFTKTPFKEKMKSFPEIREIYVVGEYKDSETQPTTKPATDIMTPATVVGVDVKDQLLEYRTAPLPGSKTTKVSKLYVADILIYSVEDPSRAHILHARKLISLSNLKVDDSILVHFKVVSSNGQKTFHPVEVLVIPKNI